MILSVAQVFRCKVTPAALAAETLGMRNIPAHGVCGHTDERMFRLRAALRVLMHIRRVSGGVVQFIAGHLSFGAVASRGAVSLLVSVCLFAVKHWMSRGTSWDSLKCEPPAWSFLVLAVIRRMYGIAYRVGKLPVGLSMGALGSYLQRSWITFVRY